MNTTRQSTERYVRESGQWVKVTRDPNARRFYFVRGWEGEVKGHARAEWTFQWVPTWADALEMARRQIADYA